MNDGNTVETVSNPQTTDAFEIGMVERDCIWEEMQVGIIIGEILLFNLPEGMDFERVVFQTEYMVYYFPGEILLKGRELKKCGEGNGV